MQRIGRNIPLAALLFVLLALCSLPSLALQPVEEFVAGARKRNPDELEARANLAQQQAQADSTLGRVLPGVTASGSYIRNQYGSTIDIAQPGQPPNPITLVPTNQWDGSATLKVPLIDLAGFRRVSAARTSAEAFGHQLEATRLLVEGQVVQGYYQVVANLALVAASRSALDVSREGLRLAQARYQAGTAAALDVDRARADVEQQVQQLANAELQVALAARSLESTSSVQPDVSTVTPLSDDLHPEPELETFATGLARLPAVAAAGRRASPVANVSNSGSGCRSSDSGVTVETSGCTLDVDSSERAARATCSSALASCWTCCSTSARARSTSSAAAVPAW